MLWQRLLFGSLLIAAICGIVILDGRLSADALPLTGIDVGMPSSTLKCALPVTLLVVFLTVLASYELGRLCVAGGYKPVTHWAAFVGAGLAIVPWIEMQLRLGSASTLLSMEKAHLSLTVLWLTGGFIGACFAVLMRKSTERAISHMAVTLFMIFYLGLMGSFVVRIRCLIPGAGGAALVVFYILTVKFGDIGAYFCGKLFGKHKLAYWLSPGKTIEGFVGALLLAGGMPIVGMLIWNSWDESLGKFPLSIAQVIIFGLVMAIVGHLGDLVESAVKRDVKAKDSGQIIPAFGGILDLIDSPLFAAPIGWILLTFWVQMG